MTLKKLYIPPKTDNAAKKQMVQTNAIGANETLLASEVNAMVAKTNELVDAYNFGAPITAFNFKGKLSTYVALANIVNPQVNDGYAIEADGLVYVYNGTTFPSEGEGMNLGLKPVGKVQSGDALAVSGDEVYKNLYKKTFKENVVHGGIDRVSGIFSNDLTRARVVNLIQKKGDSINISLSEDSNLSIRNYVLYDINQTVISGVNLPANTKTISLDITNETFWGVSLAKSNLTEEITEEEISNTKLIIDYGTQVDFEKIKDSIVLVEQSDKAIINRHYVDFELGAISTSDFVTLLSSTQRIRSVDFINLELGETYNLNVPQGFKTHRIMGYNNKVPVGSIGTNPTSIKPSAYSQVKFVFAKIDDTQIITPEELANFKFTLTKLEKEPLKELLEKLPYFDYFKQTLQFLKDLRGKKLTVIGHSIPYGYIPRNSPGYPGQLESYVKLAAKELDMEFVNLGVSGSTVGQLSNSDTITNSPFIYRYQNIPLDSDVILIDGATNDLRKISRLGNINSTDPTTFMGAYNLLITGILERHVYNNDLNIDVNIILATPIKIYPDIYWGNENLKMEDYRNAIIQLADKYSLLIFDAWNLSGLTPSEFRTLQGTEVGYTDMYNPLITDGVHPTQLGHKLYSKNFIKFLRNKII